MKRGPLSFFKRLHRDDRGNIAILTILIAMFFVDLLALVWNAAEYGARRRHVQLAADSAANAVQVWNSRTVNLVAGSNMVIGENASAEIIFRAVQQTEQGVTRQLASDLVTANNNLRQLQTQIQQETTNPNPNAQQHANLMLQYGLESSAVQIILQYIPLQQNEIVDFESITAPAYTFMTADDFAPRRADVYAYQQQVVEMQQQSITAQLAAISTQSNVDLTIALPTGNGAPTTFGSAIVNPPLKEVQYVNIDPIVHQGVDVPYMGGTVHVNGGQWGEIDDPPLDRYVRDRVSRDSQGMGRVLLQFLSQIDMYRNSLGQALNALLRTPNNATGGTLQAYTQAQMIVLGIGRPGPWFNPGAISHGWGFQVPFAVNAWNGALRGNTRLVLQNMGNEPQLALITYDRYPIPEWAQSSVEQNTFNYVSQDLRVRIQQNPDVIVNQMLNLLVQADLQPVSAARRLQLQNQARTTYWQVATPAINAIASDVANQWISQDWPFEITPPQTATPMPPGIRDQDRLAFYTVMIGARANDQGITRPLMTKMFGTGEKLVAYAQAETFNWMEYNNNYGASDNYTIYIPPDSFTYATLPPNSWPAPWRVSTRGGWSWNPRLAFADGLGAAVSNNLEFREFMDSAGVTNYEPAPMSVLNQH